MAPRQARRLPPAEEEEPRVREEALRRAHRARETGVAEAPAAVARVEEARPGAPRSLPGVAAQGSARTPSPTPCSGPAR